MLQTIPWVFSVTTALCFGVMARRAGRNWVAWAVGGASYSLAISTMVLGVSQASFIPLSSGALVLFYIRSIAAAGLVVGLLGWLLIRSLPRPRPAASDHKQSVDSYPQGKR